jgi:hypothetical protein
VGTGALARPAEQSFAGLWWRSPPKEPRIKVLSQNLLPNCNVMHACGKGSDGTKVTQPIGNK